MPKSVKIANSKVGCVAALGAISDRASDEAHTQSGRVNLWDRFHGSAVCAALLGALVVCACAATSLGATDVNLTRARSGSSLGAALYQQNCAGCHGERGKSVSTAPNIMGAGALPVLPAERNPNTLPGAGDPETMRLMALTRPAGAPSRDPFHTAQDLYDYVSRKMPLPAAKSGRLAVEQYWAIINFMLLAHGVQLPPEGVTAANAGAVKL